MSSRPTKLHLTDILGPIMVGPSSSHTAGACRLAGLALKIYEDKPRKVVCRLHGSFAATYQGHGSDRALAGGLLGFSPDDPRLRDALDLAPTQGLDISFQPIDLGPVHPNTIRFDFIDEDQTFTVTGSSLGGAAVEIIDINGTEVAFNGDYPTLIIGYPDRLGMVRDISKILASHELNIAKLGVTRRDKFAAMVIELDKAFSPEALADLRTIPGIATFKALD